MKNIHILPADKPSNLFKDIKNKLMFNKDWIEIPIGRANQHIYITSDEEIKEGINQWYLDKFINKPRNSSGSQYGEKQDVIILTTDQDLIKDGVQAIDDEFLEWFVKNPSCERVKIERGKLQIDDDGQEYGFPDMSKYKIIIPKEEPKQDYSGVHLRHCYQGEYEDGCKYGEDDYPAKPLEPKQETLTYSEASKKEERIFNSNILIKETLEEAAENEASIFYKKGTIEWNKYRQVFELGAKWQQEQDKNKYSEEEIIAFGKSCFYKGFDKAENDDANCYTAFREEIGSIIEQYKKK